MFNPTYQKIAYIYYVLSYDLYLHDMLLLFYCFFVTIIGEFDVLTKNIN